MKFLSENKEFVACAVKTGKSHQPLSIRVFGRHDLDTDETVSYLISWEMSLDLQSALEKYYNFEILGVSFRHHEA